MPLAPCCPSTQPGPPGAGDPGLCAWSRWCSTPSRCGSRSPSARAAAGARTTTRPSPTSARAWQSYAAARRHSPPAGGHRSGHHGLCDAGRAARALWRRRCWAMSVGQTTWLTAALCQRAGSWVSHWLRGSRVARLAAGTGWQRPGAGPGFSGHAGRLRWACRPSPLVLVGGPHAFRWLSFVAGRAADRLRRRPLRARYPDGDHDPRPARARRPGARRLGRSAGHGGRRGGGPGRSAA